MNHKKSVSERMKGERQMRVEARAFARLFDSADGKVVLDALERELGWREPSSVGTQAGTGVDPLATMVRDGQKVALKFIHDMRFAGSRVVSKDKDSDETEYKPKDNE